LTTVSIVFLVYNRCDELRTSLREMLSGDAWDPRALDVIVVDNASEDGSSEMVRDEFPGVRVIAREVNCGVSAWNDGFAVARGDWVLALDDDCYLPGDGLKRAIAAAQEHAADLVSFSVRSGIDPDYRFDEAYRGGLLSFWGCAVLLRREALEALGGFDPQIFIWAHELEFMLRFFDRGFRHLHLPEVTAVHIKPTPVSWREYKRRPGYRINAKHWGYIAAKLLRPRDAVEALIALVTAELRDALRVDRKALAAVPEALRGFAIGLRHRDPVRPEVSRTYRRKFHTFASPWWLSRTLRELVRSLGRTADPSAGRRELYYAERAPYYPREASTLDFLAAGEPVSVAAASASPSATWASHQRT
jgi:GT2 family glycosyltransferase